ncbi:glycoside hydrolase family 13 protein [Candidatus Rhodoluna planktonica]|uniref:Alpha-amylase n=1 Tax=Candidatus Rhodoluna planktonica TaxID=535712 RepID=A0A1D9E0K1_9MICO|nr:glycoside hydrolase family 13 protein [Candidatus Rhodoluna planktonica]AOY56593.1 alpha-amylase [Candidatus Rhodoluna planktonica]
MSEYTFLTGPADWWRQAVVYQIYPRSFADENGDGIGDLKGIISRIPYLKKLGVDAVWLSPFYPSALADGGYDVADYRDVDPRIGTLTEFDEMVNELHRNEIRIFVDIVPNHSSDLHPWFQAALKAAPGSTERERYIFRDGKGEHGEIRPSELVSHFGPTGWTRITEPDGKPGQWYMHLFAKEQPDFNWDNPEVREDFLKTLRFWSDRGVDGYRVDVAHALVKNLKGGHLPNRLAFDLEVMKNDGTDDLFDRDEVHEIYAEWRKVFNQYDPPRVAVAEAWVHANRRAAYASEKGLGQAFSFDLLGAPWRAKKFKEIIDYNLKSAKSYGSSTTWVFSNHDVIRHATRFGLPNGTNLTEWFLSPDRESKINFKQGLERARAATMLILALPGSTYLYQGEELGLHEPLNIPSERMQDPQWFRNPGKALSRDGCRVPLPWSASGTSFGFGPGGSHLPQPSWFADVAVDKQDGVEGSTLELYRQALSLRRKLQTVEELRWVNHIFNNKVVHFVRPNGWQSITNFGEKLVKLPAGNVVLTSQPLVDGKIGPNTTVWLTK